jgi:hypothetical protein
MIDYDEALLLVETGIDQDAYETTPKPPIPFDESGKAIVFDFMRIQEQDSDFSFGFGMEDAIYFLVQYAFTSGEYEGRRVRSLLGTSESPFRVSTTADDFLRACESDDRPNLNGEYKTAIESTFGPFKATGDWEWYCPDEPRKNNPSKTGVTVMRGYKKAPFLSDGVTRQHERECPECGEFLSANFTIKRYIIPKN